MWSEKQAKLLALPYDHTLDWLEGTPRSGKTSAGTARFAAHLIVSRDTSHLVVGYSAEQAFRLIMDGDGRGLMHIFAGLSRVSHDDSGAHLLIHLPDGDRRVYWKGGGKADSHKAITGMSLGSVYFCEINLLHDSMVQECFRRTYAAKDRWHIADLNPPSPADPCTFILFKWCTKTQSRSFGSPWTRALAKTHMHLNFSPKDPLAPHLSPTPKDHDNILSWDQGWKSKKIGSWSYFLLCLLTQERDCFSFLLMFWL